MSYFEHMLEIIDVGTVVKNMKGILEFFIASVKGDERW